MRNILKYLSRLLPLTMIVAILALSIIIPLPVKAYAPTPAIWEYLRTGDGGNSGTIYADNMTAQQFTANSTIVHTVTSIRISLKRTGTTPGIVKASIYEASGGLPIGTEITYGMLDGDDFSTSYAYYEFTMALEKGLSAGTEYAIVIQVPFGTATDYIMWQKDTGGDGLATTVGSYSMDGGITWTSGTPDYVFEIWGNPAMTIVGANVFEDYLVDDDMLVVAECINIYPEYYNKQDAATYFNVQLVSTDNITVFAATTLKDWGDKPIGIYLSASTATPLTHGAPYIVRMIGTFTGTPSANYTLQSADWKGSDLTKLDEWVRNTAYSMNDYDGNISTVPYITYVTDVGKVLTSQSGAYFTSGIPALSQVRPDLFSYVKTQPTFIKGVANPVFDTAFTWDTMVGADIAADATTFGTIFGVAGNTFLAMIFIAMILFALIFVFFNANGADTPQVLLLCIPLLLFANYLRVIPIQFTVVLGAVLALLFVRAMWWKAV